MAHLTDGAIAMMELLGKRLDVLLPSPDEISVARAGDVLSAKHILKVDLQDALYRRSGPTGMISGAPYFRIVPKLNIVGVAQANRSAVRTIVNELRRAHVEGPIVWVNLREEPLIYINNAAHIVRERRDPHKPIIISNVTGPSIETIEDKLKQEVLQEARDNGGNISVYVEGKDGVMENQWESAHALNVATLWEIFRDLSREYGRGQLHYYRRPITQNIGPRPDDFDFVLNACLEEPAAVFVFNCQTGRGRTSAMMQMASIVRFYQFCAKDISVDVRVMRGAYETPTFRTIQKLVSLFPDGKLHERRLNILMDFADRVYSMADHINEAFSGVAGPRSEEAMMRLQQYALFLVFSYYCEQRLWNYATKLSFVDWLDNNPDIGLLITSVRDKLNDQLSAEKIRLEILPDSATSAAETKAMQWIHSRRGNVLGSGCILCTLPMHSNPHEVRALRQLAPDVPIFTCGRLSADARLAFLKELRATFPADDGSRRKVHWLSTRAEPMVVINGISYTLTDFTATPIEGESGITMHVSVKAIEQVEDRLRRDVLLEAQEHGGLVLLHHISASGRRTFQEVKVCSVRTPRSLMEEFALECGVNYSRVPLPFSGQILATDIDPLLEFFAAHDEDPHDIFIINDPEGSTRTSVVLNILTLYRASRLCELRSIQSTEDLLQLLRVSECGTVLPSAYLAGALSAKDVAEGVPERHVELLLASTICQVLTAGTLLRTVNAAIALGGSGVHYNILHRVDYMRRRLDQPGADRRARLVNTLHTLRCYLIVLLSSLYLDERGGYTPEMIFSEWVEAHVEVSHIIQTLESRGESALRYVTAENLMRADVSRRCGDVLTANFCLKADHFPGSQRKGLRPHLCGAPNFRKVHNVNVYGVAIPTILGVHNILSLLGASTEPLATYPGQSNDTELYKGFAAPRLFDPTFRPETLQQPLRGSVVWVNLREEPILYVGDRPFVFRDLAAPYVNVELTGIQTSKVELVEVQLKVDVLTEAQQYGGKFLVHDEANPGELVGVWEVATEDTVKTLREVYAELAAKGFRCHAVRLPVTDEQSPTSGDFDQLVQTLLPHITEHMDRRETLSFVFNCQMGRGRTTTGTIICCLLIGLVMPEYYNELQSSDGDLYREGPGADLWNGDYEVIVQLKRVLGQGRQAKLRVDLAIESCSQMQNIRTAIEDFVGIERSPDHDEASRARAHHTGVHYLLRYFNLIVFDVYLNESYDRIRRRVGTSFEDWLKHHPELRTLAATAALH